MRDGWPARLQGVHLKAGQLRKMYNDYGEPETLLARWPDDREAQATLDRGRREAGLHGRRQQAIGS